jgi:hypothetical protein
MLRAIAVLAALVCYYEEPMPLVSRFASDAHGNLLAYSRGRVFAFDGRTWRDAGKLKDTPEPTFPCPDFVKKRNDAKASYDDIPLCVCTQTDDYIYVGLAYYEGEGGTGRGGLVRIRKRDGRVTDRRSTKLDDVSINAIAAEGDVVWFGTTHHGECVGLPIAHGLVRYNFATGEFRTFEKSDDGPAGFVIHDIRIEPSWLWVATDLGISRMDRKTGAWQHWLPGERATRVDALYARLLKSMPQEVREQIREGLARFRPRTQPMR